MRDTTVSELHRLTTSDAAEMALHMDEEAFRAFYTRTSRALWAYLSRTTGDRQQADDLMQEAYFRLLRTAGRYESDSHRRHALFHIATNLVRDTRRRKTPLPLGDHDARMLAATGDPALDAEQRTDLARAMAQLTPRERAMLWLAYAEGESHREIAGRLGVKVASMKLLLFRARRKLAALLRGPRS